jgi:hypothetical protein
MPHVNPLNLFSCANRVGDSVQRVAANTVDLPNSCFSENLHQQVCYFFLGHDAILSDGMKEEFNFFPVGVVSLSGHTTAQINATPIPTIG